MSKPRSNDSTLVGFFEGGREYFGNFDRSSHPRNQYRDSSIGRASSLDGGATWNQAPDPVLTASLDDAKFDQCGVFSPWTIKVGGTIYMYYAGFNAVGGAWVGIGLATSTDGGYTFHRVNGPNVDGSVLIPGAAYDMDQCNFPVVWYDKNEFDVQKRWKMLYSAVTVALPSYTIAAAFSPDGINWVKQGSVISPSPNPLAFDNASVIPGALYFNGYWYLIYSGGGTLPAIGATSSEVGLAWSRDFLTWQKWEDNSIGVGNHKTIPIISRRANATTTLSAPWGGPPILAQEEIQVNGNLTGTRFFEEGEPVVVFEPWPPFPALSNPPGVRFREMLCKVETESLFSPFPGGAGNPHAILLDRGLVEFGSRAILVPFSPNAIVRSILYGSLLPRMMLRQGDTYKVSLSTIRYFLPDDLTESPNEQIRANVVMCELLLPNFDSSKEPVTMPASGAPVAVPSNGYARIDYKNAPVLRAGRYFSPDEYHMQPNANSLWYYCNVENLCCLLDMDCEGELVETEYQSE